MQRALEVRSSRRAGGCGMGVSLVSIDRRGIVWEDGIGRCNNSKGTTTCATARPQNKESNLEEPQPARACVTHCDPGRR